MSNDNKDNVGEETTTETVEEIKLPLPVKIKYPPTSEVTIKDDSVYVYLPSDTTDSVKASLAGAVSTIKDSGEDIKEWAEAVSGGTTFSPMESAFESSFKNRQFHQDVKSPVGNLVPMESGLKAIVPGQELKGEEAVVRAIVHIGSGNVISIPLYSSGIWITLKPPSEGALLELHRTIVNDKKTLGRYSYGLVYSNTASYTIRRLIDFALDHMIETSIKADVKSKTVLKEYLLTKVISTHDTFTIIWGILWSIYTNGFEYKRSCISDPDSCHYVAEELLDLGKLLYVAADDLSEEQITHMASASGKSRTVEEVKDYKKELDSSKEKLYNLESSSGAVVTFSLSTPFIQDYIDSGYEWIESITKSVDESLGIDATDGARESYMLSNAKSSSMVQYAHWVKYIQIDGNPMHNKDSIRRVLSALSTDDVLRDGFIDACQEYINDTAISVIGIPSFVCPQCNKDQKEENPDNIFRNILPLDIIQLFFTLASTKVSSIEQRDRSI